MILAQLEEKIGGRIAEDVKGYSKAIDIFGKQIGKIPETINSSLKKSLLLFRKLFVYVILRLCISSECASEDLHQHKCVLVTTPTSKGLC